MLHHLDPSKTDKAVELLMSATENSRNHVTRHLDIIPNIGLHHVLFHCLTTKVMKKYSTLALFVLVKFSSDWLEDRNLR